MIATIGIFLVALALVVATGVVAEALVAPSSGFRIRARTPGVGFSVLVVTLIALGAAWPTSTTTWIFVALLGLATGAAAILVTKARRRGAGRAELWTRDDTQGLALLGCGTLVSLLALTPVLRLGFPTTIAAANNDGWSYAGMSAWLTDHAWPAEQGTPHIYDVFGGVIGAQLRDGFGVGFESMASVVSQLTAYPTYAVVQATGAVVFVVAASGWFHLGQLLVPSLGTGRLALLALPAAAPALVTIFSENYLPHAFGIAMVPVTIAALVNWFRSPSIATGAWSGITLAAIACVYPGIAPWVLGPWMLLSAHVVVRAARGRSGEQHSAWRTAGLLLTPAAVMLATAPYQSLQTATFLIRKASGAAVPYPSLGLDGAAAFAVGARGPSSLLGPLTTGGLITTLVLGLLLATGLCFLAVAWRANVQIVLSALGIAGVSAFAILRFSSLPDFAYGVFKVLANSGALLAGFAMLGLLLGSMTWKPVPMLAIGALVGAMWVIASWTVLSNAYRGHAGFRANDITAGRELARLPETSVTLVEGTTDTGEVFHRRMALAYFGQQEANRTLIGLGTTGSYMAPPGTPVWRPAVPWDYVFGDGGEQMSPGRVALWSNGAYTLWRAPSVDSTPYGANWYALEQLPGGGSFRWTAGQVEFLVSNRRPTASRVRVSLDLLAWGRPRVAVLRKGSAVISRTPVSTATEAQMSAVVTVPPRQVTVLRLSSGPGTTGPANDPRDLSMRIASPRIAAVHIAR
jgi:hypothetical protein